MKSLNIFLNKSMAEFAFIGKMAIKRSLPNLSSLSNLIHTGRFSTLVSEKPLGNRQNMLAIGTSVAPLASFGRLFKFMLCSHD